MGIHVNTVRAEKCRHEWHYYHFQRVTLRRKRRMGCCLIVLSIAYLFQHFLLRFFFSNTKLEVSSTSVWFITIHPAGLRASINSSDLPCMADCCWGHAPSPGSFAC